MDKNDQVNHQRAKSTSNFTTESATQKRNNPPVNFITGQVRYWSLTSLNITQMISDNDCTVIIRLIHVIFLLNYFYDDFTVIIIILFIDRCSLQCFDAVGWTAGRASGL